MVSNTLPRACAANNRPGSFVLRGGAPGSPTSSRSIADACFRSACTSCSGTHSSTRKRGLLTSTAFLLAAPQFAQLDRCGVRLLLQPFLIEGIPNPAAAFDIGVNSIFVVQI